MVGERQPSRLERIERRRGAAFVGRLGESTAFRANLALGTGDEEFTFVFHVRGNGGVGKTSLLRRWADEARRHRAVTAYLDEGVQGTVEAMEAISAQLARQGVVLKDLDRRMKVYRERRHEAAGALAAGPAGPGDEPSPALVAAARATLVGLGMTPVVGAFSGVVDAPQLARLGADWWSALSARLHGPDDVDLVLSPERVLTPVFVKDLTAVAADRPWVVLFFDTYEQTGRVLDGWLRDLVLGGDHGELPLNVVVVLAGRDRLGPGWRGMAADVPLDVFSEDEARRLLAHRGITEERLVRRILRVSGRLPVLVDMLAGARPPSPDAVEDPAGTAVELFLKWESDPARQAAALACALPLRLNEDVYAAAVPDPVPGGYAWLRGLAFVTDQAGRCRYHEVVRAAMLRVLRVRSPIRWSADHARLAAAFAGWRRAQQEALPAGERWADPDWRDLLLNETYHELCAHPRRALPRALRRLVRACEHGAATARRWAQTITEAGHDTGSDELAYLGHRLLDASTEHDADVTPILAVLLAAPAADPATRALALAVRGREHRRAERYDDALADYTAGLALDPESARAHAGRGETFRVMGRREEALRDLDRAIELVPDDAAAIASRAQVHRSMGRYDEAFAGYDRAVALRPDYAWAIAYRAQTHQLVGRPDAALADYDRAIELRPDYPWCLAHRANLHRAAGRHEAALRDLDHAIRLDADYLWAIGERGYLLDLLGRHEAALADFDRAVAQDPGYAWAIANRGNTLRQLGRHQAALADYDQAVALDPGYVWALTNRGLAHARLGRDDDALADLDRAVALDPEHVPALARRAVLHRLAGRPDAAAADVDRVRALRPDYHRDLADRGRLHRISGRYEAALTDLRCAVELAPDTPSHHYELGVAMLATGDPRHADHLRRAIELATAAPARPGPVVGPGGVFLAHCALRQRPEADAALTAFLAGGPAPGAAFDLSGSLDTLVAAHPPLADHVEDFRRRLAAAGPAAG